MAVQKSVYDPSIKICRDCQVTLAGSLDHIHCKDMRYLPYNCKCPCRSPRYASCWVRGCRKQCDVVLGPFGRLCPYHLEVAVRQVEGQNTAFFRWYKRYRSFGKGATYKLVKSTPTTTRIERAARARKDAEILAKMWEKLLRDIEQ